MADNKSLLPSGYDSRHPFGMILSGLIIASIIIGGIYQIYYNHLMIKEMKSDEKKDDDVSKRVTALEKTLQRNGIK